MTKKRPERRDGRAKGEQGKGRESKKIDSDTEASKHRRNRTDPICTQKRTGAT